MRTRAKAALLLALLAVMVNLPYLQNAWTQHRVGTDGVVVDARVTDTRALEGGYLVRFTFPEDLDPEGSAWTAQVERATYDEAVTTQQVSVRVLADQPAAHRVQGQVVSRTGLWITLGADALLVLLALALWRSRGASRPELVLVATQDVQATEPGSALERVEGSLYVVAGEVLAIEPDHLMLDLGDRRVRVELHGHLAPVSVQQHARVTGHLVG